MIKIAIIGALGRMGREIALEVLEDPHATLKGACIRPEGPEVGKDYGTALGLRPLGVTLTDSLEDAVKEAEVLIDFSHPERLKQYRHLFTHTPKALVIGTTNLGSDEYQALDTIALQAPVFYSPNMSLGVHVLQKLVTEATRLLPQEFQLEIIDRHHQFKRDAPSGTALQLAQKVALERQVSLEEVMTTHRSDECRARKSQEIGVLSLRAGGLVGQHDVHFISSSEQIVLSHQAFSRRVFAQGALRTARWLKNQKPGLYGMNDLVTAL
jgi:4-hydroxy-tetrahydrodipicolinate reductase